MTTTPTLTMGMATMENTVRGVQPISIVKRNLVNIFSFEKGEGVYKERRIFLKRGGFGEV